MFTIIGSDQRQYGPATAEQVREWIRIRRANADTLARSDSSGSWKPLATFLEFQGLFATREIPPLATAALPIPRSKYSLVLGPEGPMTKERAWVCLTTNLGLPGFGSIFGRRRIGYAQIIFTLASFALSLTTGMAMLLWYSKNFQRLQQSEEVSLGEVWDHLRWPLASLLLFGIAFLWAFITSLSLLAEARRTTK